MEAHRLEASQGVRRPRRAPRAGVLAVVGVAWLLAACANLDGVKQFAAGVDGLARSSDDFYQMQSAADRRLRLANVDLTEPWDAAVGSEALASEFRRHRAAVAALQAYAQGLNNLATVSDSKDIEAAATELSGAFTSLSKTLTGSAVADESALASAFTAVARAYVDVKAQRAITRAVRAAQSHVETILTTLQRDIERQRGRVVVGAEATNSRREKLYEGLRAEFASAAPADKALRTIAAQTLVGDQLDDRRADPGDDALLRQFEAATDSCLKAHTALGQRTSSTDTIKTFTSRIKDLVAAVQRLVKS